jgi:hypothetical protein
MPFVITPREGGRILEVEYPAHPTKEEVSAYALAIRSAIRQVGTTWGCLVDQRRLVLMPPDVVAVMAELNAFAQSHRMAGSARLVSSKMAQLQATRLAREATLKVPLRTFDDRELALQWLRELLGSKPLRA